MVPDSCGLAPGFVIMSGLLLRGRNSKENRNEFFLPSSVSCRFLNSLVFESTMKLRGQSKVSAKSALVSDWTYPISVGMTLPQPRM